MVQELSRLPVNPPSLFMDLEGANLSRDGTLSLLTIYAQPKNHVYIVDITTLQSAAFDLALGSGMTLRGILQSPTIPKVLFDVRNDSDALFAHYGVSLAAVEDVQLMEVAARPAPSKDYVRGLANCIKYDAVLPPAEKTAWNAAKDVGVKLFAPERGGSYDVFDVRPLSPEIQLYCINDVRYLPALRNLYWSRLNAEWKSKVLQESAGRVALSQDEKYQPNGPWKSLSPWLDPCLVGK